MLIGTTFAWFTDEVSSGCNKIVAGNLEVDLEILAKDGTWSSLKESKAPIFNYDKWEPGYTEVTILKVDNEGTLALKWKALFTSEANLSILADVIDVYVLVGATEYPDSRDLEALGYKKVGTVAEFVNSIEETTYGFLEAGQSATLGIALKMQESAGNEYKGLSLGGAFDISIFATQYAFESDSFDNQYDVDPEEPVLVSRSGMLQEGQDSMNVNLFHKGSKLLSVNVPASAIEDTSKPVKVTVAGIDPSEEAMVDESTQAYAYDIKVTNLKANLTGDQLITVVVAAPNALAAMQAYHNGVLIEDAVYDEVAGTITFKTASFSPFDFTSNVEKVETLEELRAALQKDGTTAKLMANITVDLTNGSTDRDANHAYPSKEAPRYYNGVKISAKDVGVDLNGHSITVYCGDAYNSNDDVGALFFVAEYGSLNITNTGDVETGFIKMESSIYAVWAPYASPSYVDIYGGAFIADSYAGDTVGTPLGSDGKYDPENGTMSITQENSNRSIIYAGHGGNINVYGGYFLYNNTINDKSNRNNGAFNAKDYYEDGALITIHEGVYLSNKEYRQNPYRNPETNPSFDDYSIKLAEDHVINEVNLDSPVVIDGEEYSTWYEVQRTYYELIFKDNGGEKLDTVKIPFTEGAVTVDDIDDTAYGKLPEEYKNDFGGWTNAASDPIGTIEAGNTKDIVLYPVHSKKYTVTWLDEDGNVLNAVPTSGNNPKYSSVKASAPPNPASKYDDLTFSHWEVRTVVNGVATSVEITDRYQIKSNISLYPVYEYNGSLDLIAVDTDGDGVANHYAVAGSDLTNSPDFIIPADVNGIPVLEIRTGAFADGDLRDVVIPNSVNYIGKNAFCADGGEFPQIQIIFEGTKAEWNALPKADGWDDNIGHDSVIVCTEEDPIGYYNQAGSNGFLGIGARVNWKWVSGTPDWYPRNYD